jgi:hypothetical protein
LSGFCWLVLVVLLSYLVIVVGVLVWRVVFVSGEVSLGLRCC